MYISNPTALRRPSAMARAPIHTPANFLTSRCLESRHLGRHGCLRSPFLSQTPRPLPASQLVIVGGCVIAGYARKSVDSAGVYQLTDDDDFTVSSSDELRYDGDETVDDGGAYLNSRVNFLDV